THFFDQSRKARSLITKRAYQMPVTGRRKKRFRALGTDKKKQGMGQSIEAVSHSASVSQEDNEVVLTCRLVCREWKYLADSAALWRERCRRERYLPRDSAKPPKDWQRFYFLCKKRRNLLKNPSAEERLNGWQIVENGGDRWNVENMTVPYPDETKKIIQKFCPETVTFEQWNDQQWNQMTHVFRNYGPGVRFVRFEHGGNDTQYWAGWYGIRVTNSSVEIRFPEL
ncbi:hypothetical protein JZ751_023417, partial [Albula glossodonta]